MSNKRIIRSLAVSSLSIAVLLAPAAQPARGTELGFKPELFKALKYRHIGPIGNRVTSVIGIPGRPNICYAGAASGGRSVSCVISPVASSTL